MKLWALHGAVGMAQDWLYLSSQLSAKGCQCELVDLWEYVDKEMNVNHSDKGGFESFVDHFHADLLKEVQSNTGEKRILLGYSMGGRLALAHALRYPDFWDEVVIVSGHPGLEDLDEKNKRIGSDKRWAEKVRMNSWGSFCKEWNDQSVLSGALLSGGDRSLLSEKRELVAKSFEIWSLGQQANYRKLIQGFPKKISWAVGEKDHKFLEIAKELEKDTQNIFLQIFSNSGHRVPWEVTQAFELWLSDRIVT